jgi:hypothetical protein
MFFYDIISEDRIKQYARSVELPHVELVSIGAMHDYFTIEDVFEFELAQTVQVALEGCVVRGLQRKDERKPGILSGWARTCLSWRIIMDIALP